MAEKKSFKGKSSKFFSFGDKPEDISNEGVYLYFTPTLPDGPPQSETSVTLQPDGEFVVPPKADRLRVAYGWEAPGFDLDASAAMLDHNYNILDFVWWDNKKSACESIAFFSTDETAGTKEGDKEVIGLELDEIPNDCNYILLSTSVYTKYKNLDDVQSVSMRVVDIEHGDKELFSYKVETELRGSSMLLGILVRQSAYWKFVALNQPLLARTITEIMYSPENLEPAKKLEAIPLKRRMLQFSVTHGKNLTPMDIALISRTSDPYLKIIKSGEILHQTEVISATLNPEFGMEAIDIGECVETDEDVLEIQCWDWDRLTEDDFMGMIRVCVGGMCQKGPGVHEVWLPLTGTQEQKEEGVKITGELRLEFKVTNMEDFNAEKSKAEKLAKRPVNLPRAISDAWATR